MSETSVGALVSRAAAGDEIAWNEIVDRFSGLLWSVTRSYGLATQQASDVVQTAWLRLVEHIGELRDPEHVGAWLATTTRREALRTVAAQRREEPRDDDRTWDQPAAPHEAPDAAMIRREERTALLAALADLPPRQQQLLRVLSTDPAPSYQEVAAATGMPVGSIGPTRARALQRLRGMLAGDAVPGAAFGSGTNFELTGAATR
jgi:RNA polymerase sigma factor (sigma-70 family)